MLEMMSTFERLSMTAKLDLDHEAISQKVSSIMEALFETQEEADKKDSIKRKRKGRWGEPRKNLGGAYTDKIK